VTVPAGSRAALRAVLERDDPDVIGVVLTGSAARGLATEHSDVDVLVVLGDGVAVAPTLRSPAIDEIPTGIAELESPAPWGTEEWWFRWQHAWVEVLRDTPDGRVAAACRRQATLDDVEQRSFLVEGDRLDGWVNFAYRALKSDRDGRPLERRLDAAESVPWLLDVVFALAGRVRPYNKYLAWELRTHPLDVPEWSAERLLPELEAVLDGDPAPLRAWYDVVERECRAWDAAHGTTVLGDLLDGWGDERAVFR
jgi:predicted nucleotidyltransferase